MTKTGRQDWLDDAETFKGEGATVSITSGMCYTDFELTAEELQIVFLALANITLN